jgi:hypothetical protein
MDDVAKVIAMQVTSAVDGFLWDWDDIAAAAATLHACSRAPLLRAVSAALWRAVVERELEREWQWERELAGRLWVTCVTARKEHLLALARKARLDGVRASMRYAELDRRLQAEAREVGPFCPVPVRTAYYLLRLRWRWANTSVIRREYGSGLGLDLSACRNAGAQFGGTRLLLRDVRAAARAVTGAGAAALQRAAEAHRRRVAEQRELFLRLESAKRECVARRQELEAAVAAEGLPHGLLDSSPARDYVGYPGYEASLTLTEVLEGMRVFVAVLSEAGLGWDDYDRCPCAPAGRAPADMKHAALAAVRYHRLSAALAERGLRLRGDSSVCKQYVNGARDDLDDVVDIMDEMRFYYERTAYPKLLQRAPRRWNDYREYREYRDYRDYDDDDDYSDSDEDAVVFDPVAASQAAKTSALRRMRGVPADAPANVIRLASALALPLVG